MEGYVHNACYGGFGLSDKAMEMLAQRKGWTRSGDRWVDADRDRPHVWDGDPCDRDDPDLVAVVRELGKEANGQYADLHILSYLPGHRAHEWREYDGVEYVQERNDGCLQCVYKRTATTVLRELAEECTDQNSELVDAVSCLQNASGLNDAAHGTLEFQLETAGRNDLLQAVGVCRQHLERRLQRAHDMFCILSGK